MTCVSSASTTKPAKATTGISEIRKNLMSLRTRKRSSPTSEPLFWDGEDNLGTVTFGVGSLDDALRRAHAAFGGSRQEPRIDFPSFKDLFAIMTLKRWDIVHAMAGAGPM